MPPPDLPESVPPAPAQPIQPIQPGDAWHCLRQFTAARIALGRCGDSLPTREVLQFSLAHAKARDAVHQPLDRPGLELALAQAGFETLAVRSAARDRSQYLRRPDLGRRLDAASEARLAAHAAPGLAAGLPATDVVFVLADGLSALALARHALPLLLALRPLLRDWTLGPVVIAEEARVALGDPIGAALRATMVVVLVGERPGLSSPDSLGAYLTWAPRSGCTDADRNCISNIRPEGLIYPRAAHKLAYLMTEARRLGLSGVALKDDSPDPASLPSAAMELPAQQTPA